MSLRRQCKPEKKHFAQRMRANPTTAEAVLWEILREKRVSGFRFRRQAVIRGYIADFWCPSAALVIEADGALHNKERDAVRDENLERIGIKTIRFQNVEIISEIPRVVEKIKCELESRKGFGARVVFN